MSTPASPAPAAAVPSESGAAPATPASPPSPASIATSPNPKGPASAASRCRHGERGTEALRCTRCRSLRCPNCCERKTLRLEPTWLCPCGGFCMAVPSMSTRASHGPVEDLAASLGDPLLPGTRVRFGMATALLGVAAVVSAIPLVGLVGLVVSGIAYIYVVAWLLKIVRVTVHSPQRATEWPDLVDPLPDLVWPFLRALGAGAIAFAPAIAGAYRFEDGPHALGTWILFMAGCVIFPPSLAALGAIESVTALSPLVLARTLRRSPAHWVIASAFLAVAVIVAYADAALWSRIPYAGAFADAGVALFLAIAFARFLGRVVASLDAD